MTGVGFTVAHTASFTTLTVTSWCLTSSLCSRDAEDNCMFIPRSSSIDSMVSIDSKRCNPLSRRTPSPLLVPRPLDKPPPLSPSVARRLKGQRAVTGQYIRYVHEYFYFLVILCVVT